jgi:hypothetical protein
MKYLTNKQYWIILILSIIWVFIFLGLTAVIDDYVELGYWWNLLLIPNWVFIGYQLIHLNHTRKEYHKVKSKGE